MAAGFLAEYAVLFLKIFNEASQDLDYSNLLFNDRDLIQDLVERVSSDGKERLRYNVFALRPSLTSSTSTVGTRPSLHLSETRSSKSRASAGMSSMFTRI